MAHALVTLLVSIGLIDIHPAPCHRGAWCRGNALITLPLTGPSRCDYKAWPPYFQPVVFYNCKRTTALHMVRAQYGDVRKSNPLRNGSNR